MVICYFSTAENGLQRNHNKNCFLIETVRVCGFVEFYCSFNNTRSFNVALKNKISSDLKLSNIYKLNSSSHYSEQIEINFPRRI